MKYNNVISCISVGLLRFIRDTHPTEAKLMAWLETAQQGRYHVLRKAGLLLLQDGVVVLSPQHLSPDGKHFTVEHLRYNIDEETIDTLRAQESQQVDTS